jgi:hypothetical protein
VRLGGLEVDHQLEPGGLLDGEVGRVAAEHVSRLLKGAMLQHLSRRRIARLTADIACLISAWSRSLQPILLSHTRSSEGGS